MLILDGKALSEKRGYALQSEIVKLKTQLGRSPKLSVLLVGEDVHSAHFVSLKKKKCEKLGIECEILKFGEDVTEDALKQTIESLNNDSATDGILVQLPLPQHIDSTKIIECIDYNKDVDGLTSKNLGLLAAGKPNLAPCTPQGIINLLKSNDIALEGKRAVVAGRSNLVGKPVAQMLLKENCSVTIAHTATEKFEQIIAEAEILVLAMGCQCRVTPEMLRQGVVIVDVAMNSSNGKFVGDIYSPENVEALSAKCAAITPVPGGVGPMTIMSLMENIVKAAGKKAEQKR